MQITRFELRSLFDACDEVAELQVIRESVMAFLRVVEAAPVVEAPPVWHPSAPAEVSADSVLYRRDVLLEQLEQILAARTARRAIYYLARLRRAVDEVRTGALNDINLNRWQEYDEIHTDSLWIVDRRDTSGAHGAWYWGNFIPQIPHQMMLRFTRPGDWVLDPFVGSGTTLIECRRLGRNGLGVELNPDVAARATEVVAQEPNPYDVSTEVVVGDSATLDLETVLMARGVEKAHLAILHPPYHDIIRFGGGRADLSNAPTVEDFLDRFSEVVARTLAVLASGHVLVVVIGDKYQESTWVPLGFRAMQVVLDQGCNLKSIIVKNLDRTRAKRDQQALWRYRALAGGFYVFKHEYIFLFQAP